MPLVRQPSFISSSSGTPLRWNMAFLPAPRLPYSASWSLFCLQLTPDTTCLPARWPRSFTSITPPALSRYGACIDRRSFPDAYCPSPVFQSGYQQNHCEGSRLPEVYVILGHSRRSASSQSRREDHPRTQHPEGSVSCTSPAHRGHACCSSAQLDDLSHLLQSLAFAASPGFAALMLFLGPHLCSVSLSDVGVLLLSGPIQEQARLPAPVQLSFTAQLTRLLSCAMPAVASLNLAECLDPLPFSSCTALSCIEL